MTGGDTRPAYGLTREREERVRAWRAFRSDAFDALLGVVFIAFAVYGFLDPVGFLRWIGY